MWIGLITYNWAIDDKPVKILAPFLSKEEAVKAVDDTMSFDKQRGFVFEAEEVLPAWSPCSECGGHGTFAVGEWDGTEFRRTGPSKKCETCKGSGKIYKKSA